jgi:hypothetical protein
MIEGQKKMGQLLHASGLLDFTMLWPVLSWHVSETYEPFIYLSLKFLSGQL